MTSNRVFQFKITLQDVKPPVWRRIQVPKDYSFWDLHVAITDAMGWEDYHLHLFGVLNPITYYAEQIGIPDEEARWPDITEPGWEIFISRYFTADNPKAYYVYDFGDGWKHKIIFEKSLKREANQDYPKCLAGRRACPPEDCGGAFGYELFLEAIRDPSNEDHKDVLRWIGGEFDPDLFDPRSVIFDDPDERWKRSFQG